MTRLTYRHNVINVNSINTFLNIKGGLNKGVRDVYFVRALGESVDLVNDIQEIDKRMDFEMSRMRLAYKRVNLLPQLRNREDIDYYSQQYISFCENNKGMLRHIKTTTELENIIGDALSTCIRLYREVRTDLTKSIERNIGTKLLFWLDYVVGECLNCWNEKMCIKIIADNVIKEQEYLFYLFLTYLGCDIMLIQNRGDISIDKKLLDCSSVMYLGEYGSAVLTQYKKTIPLKEVVESRNTYKEEKVSKIETNKKIVYSDKQNNSHAQVTVENNREKSYEELANFASSVVLIAVHDIDGDIIGTGSGIMIGKKGYILTNNHVVDGGIFYSVRIEDDDEVYVTKEIVKYNSTTDLAILRIQKMLNPIPIYQGKQPLVRGQKVVAIGSPLGLFNSISDGIISGFREINDVDMIQFTAPISHGSSGGAVLNMQGEVIGISTAGIDSGQNINLAIGYENINLFCRGFLN